MDRRSFLSMAAACGVAGATPLTGAQAQPTQRFAAAARYSADNGGAAFLVVRNGVILAEDYANGANADMRLPLGAATRIFAPLLAGAMAQDRLLALDEPAALTLGEWGADPVKNLISVRTLLNGSSGIAFPADGPHDAATALSLPPLAAPGARFVDNPAPYVAFAELARRKLASAGGETDPAYYLTSRVLAPIGCAPIGWTRDGQTALFYDGAYVSARGWAAIGELFRRGGVWRAAPLANNIILGEAMRGSFIEPRAGFGFWLAAPSSDHSPGPISSDLWRADSPAPIDLAMAAGANGQRLYVVPSRALIVVRLPTAGAAANWSDAQFLSQLWPDL